MVGCGHGLFASHRNGGKMRAAEAAPARTMFFDSGATTAAYTCRPLALLPQGSPCPAPTSTPTSSPPPPAPAIRLPSCPPPQVLPATPCLRYRPAPSFPPHTSTSPTPPPPHAPPFPHSSPPPPSPFP